jgi:hypothetical protein
VWAQQIIARRHFIYSVVNLGSDKQALKTDEHLRIFP